MILYYITDRSQFPGDECERRARLLERIAEATRCGIDYIQLREKDLSGRDLETLARAAAEIIRQAGETTKLLINSRSDIALAIGADGVHLHSRDVSPEDVRKIWQRAGMNHKPLIAVSCHTQEDVTQAKDAGAQFVVFGPVFEKRAAPLDRPTGLNQLRSACQLGVPVFALGGITIQNAESCMQAGAVGIAGIRLFQEEDLGAIVKKLRALPAQDVKTGSSTRQSSASE